MRFESEHEKVIKFACAGFKVCEVGCAEGCVAAVIPNSLYVGICDDEKTTQKCSSEFPNHTFKTMTTRFKWPKAEVYLFTMYLCTVSEKKIRSIAKKCQGAKKVVIAEPMNMECVSGLPKERRRVSDYASAFGEQGFLVCTHLHLRSNARKSDFFDIVSLYSEAICEA